MGRCCQLNLREEYTRQRRLKERRSKPQPWIVRKLTVAIALALLAYLCYVYLARLCLPAIRRSHSIASRPLAIAFLVVFSLLAALTLWSYYKIVVTSPGYARDHVQPSPPPDLPPPLSHPYPDVDVHSEKPLRSSHSPATDSSPPPAIQYSRRPPTHPQLAPEYRYCRKCNLVKPMRAHHCRFCGTCVLQYDHHCPWIGQCVGAFNHKFFVNFLQWSSLFCAWSFASLLALVLRNPQNIDPQHIVAIALSAFFLLFTLALLASHIHLILLNQTTVEALRIRDIKQRESDMLRAMFSVFACRRVRATKKEWDAEWGDLQTEGNLWWLGSTRANWEATMGTNKWAWFLPIGRTPGDGVTYPINPRFDPQGRWRRRAEWPAELR